MATTTRKSRKALTQYPRIHCTDFTECVSLTEQSHKDKCDINKIIDRFARTNTIDHISKYQASYDAIPADDLLTAQLKVQQGTQMFAELPSDIRSKFDQDPVKFLQFMQDPANKTEWQELGLAIPNQKPDATIQDIVNAIKETAAPPPPE